MRCVVPDAVTRCSSMACSSAACVFGGVRLISSASRMFVKIGPRRKRKRRSPVFTSCSSTSVPVMSLGMRSGVNWIRFDCQRERLRQACHERGLCQAGHAHQQAVAAREQRHEQQLHRRLLPDDAPAQLL